MKYLRNAVIIMAKIKKIIALVPAYFGYSGSAVNERQFLKALARKCDKLYVITPIRFSYIRIIKLSLKDKEKNMVILPLPLPPRVTRLLTILSFLSISYICALLLLIADKLSKIDLIYVRGSWLAIGFTMFRRLRSKLLVKIPSLIEMELVEKTLTSQIIKWLTNILDRAVILKSRWTAAPTLDATLAIEAKRKAKPLEQWVILPPGIDYHKITKIRKKTRKKLRKKSVLCVGFLGSLYWWQGVDILVKAIAILKNRGLKSIELIIVGDGPERRKILQLCEKLKVLCKIYGYVPHEKALSILSTFDIMVVPSRKFSSKEYSLPIKIIEAWALGVPIIATKHKVFDTFNIKHKVHIMYCDANPESIANTLERLIREKKLMLTLRKNGPKIARTFDYSVIADHVVKLLTS